jgi:hypothetical protein
MTKPNGTGAAETKPDEGKKKPTDGSKPVEKGMDKPAPSEDKGDKNASGNNAPMPKKKLDEKQLKELEDAAKDLNNPDPKKKEEAQKKLDKAIGEEKRKELEQLAKDLQSPDKAKQEEAKKKLEKMKQQMKDGQEPTKGDTPKPDEQQMKEIADAMKDLESGDPKKQDEARKKLDKMVGEGARKEAEQLMKDLKSDDKEKREAAQKKLDDLKKQIDKIKKDTPNEKGKEPSPEEIADLMKKAQDLNSPDEKKRQQAEKELDDKIGKENREKLQEEMKKKEPKNPKDFEDLKKELEKWRMGPRGGSPEAKGPMEDDAKNRLKTAELNLEEFEKNRYNKALQAKQGWTQEEYDEFLKGYRKRVEDMRKEVEKSATAPRSPGGPSDPGTPLTGPGGGKVENSIGGKSGPVTTGGRTAPAPGFEDARRKFEEALRAKKP